VDFSPNGQWIVAGSMDGTARVWDAASGKELRTLEGHSAGGVVVAFSSDGHRIITGSGEQTAKLWDTASGEELITLKEGMNYFSVALAPDSRRVVTVSDDNMARIWKAATADQVAAWQKEEKEASQRVEARRREQADAAERERATRSLDPGAIKQWLILAPISVEGSNSAKALAEELVPGESNIRARPRESVQVGGSEMVWQTVQLDDFQIHFNRVVGANAPWSLAYATCYIDSAEELAGLSMKVGSHDQAKVYLNGKEIYHQDWTRSYVPDKDTVENVELKKGLNTLVFKVINEDARGEDEWCGSIRFTAAAGQPVKGIRVTLDPGK